MVGLENTTTITMIHTMKLEMDVTHERFALIDIEYIQTSEQHKCIRKLYILAKDGYTELEREFYVCKRYKQLDRKYKRAFDFCRKNIHKLTYEPDYFAPPCKIAGEIVKNFLTSNQIQYMLYKGGTIEKDLCNHIDVKSFNIECIQGITKANTHDPVEEVRFYYRQLLDKVYIVL